MAYIKVDSPEYLITPKNVIECLKREFPIFSNKELWEEFADNAEDIVLAVLYDIYDYEAGSVDADSLSNLKDEVYDYLFN